MSLASPIQGPDSPFHSTAITIEYNSHLHIFRGRDMIGRKLAQYEVVARVGQGGMGEVFRARDTRLGRDVALKVLPEEFVRDRERLSRFEREARMLAQLQHDNVAAVYGFEQDEGRPLLVMELVEGEDLAARLGRGALPPEEAGRLALQIARGLEAAHEKGIVHRDLKPANVRITPEGKVKILDFGLARALAGEPSAPAGGTELLNSPTLGQALTGAGVVLGTAAYMSPEQARGRPVDRRADIWAFGVILYEMLAGKRLFEGDTASDVLAAVLRHEPDWGQLPAQAPLLAQLCRRCLERDPQLRLRDIGEARVALDGGGGSMLSSPGLASGTALAPPPRRPRAAVLASVALPALLALAAGLWAGRGPLATPAPDGRLVRSEIALPPGVSPQLALSAPGPLQVSPDGLHLAFAGRDSTGQTMLFVRPLDSLEARPLNGTRGAAYPFWSPDSRTLAFFSNGKLQRVDIDGGPVVTLCPAGNGKGGSWAPDGTILFAPSHVSAIHRVPASGGEPEPVTTLAQGAGQRSHRFPIWLPGGKHFIYMVWKQGRQTGGSESYLHVAALDGSLDRELLLCRTNTVFANGHLLYVVESNLMARPFSIAKLDFTGPAVPLERDVLTLEGAHWGVFSASADGILAYHRGEGRFGLDVLEWIDPRTGAAERLGEPGFVQGFAAGPRGDVVALGLADEKQGTFDIWLQDVARGLRTRFTFDPESEMRPVWSPDGRWLAYRADGVAVSAILRQPASGGGAPDTLISSRDVIFPTDWSPDGRTLCYASIDTAGEYDLWLMSVEGDRSPHSHFVTRFNEAGGAFSPDGRWLAYMSDENGSIEVFVAAVAPGGGRWRVSSGTGMWPRWSPAGDRLFYITMEGVVMSTEVADDGAALRLGRTATVAESVRVTPGISTLDVDPSTGRLLVQRAADSRARTPLILVADWPRALSRR